ncbi:hypothetical protein KDL45_17625, partial [bacterium]|nr:hypothetical protein [bacterium]
MHAFISAVLRLRYWILVLVVAISAGAVFLLSEAVVGTSLAQLFLGDSPEYADYLELIEEFGSDEIVIAALADQDPLDPEVQRKLDIADKNLGRIEGVMRTASILDAQSIRTEDDTLIVESHADRANALGEDRESYRHVLADDHFVGGLLVSTDGRDSAVLIEMEGGDRRPAELTVDIIRSVRQAFVDAGFPAESVKLVGQPTDLAASMEATNFNLKRLFPLTALMLVIAVWFMFHR